MREQVNFARGGETLELRGDAPSDLVRALDALALADDKTRHAYCLEILERHVQRELHRLSVLSAALRGNPLVPDALRREHP